METGTIQLSFADLVLDCAYEGTQPVPARGYSPPERATFSVTGIVVPQGPVQVDLTEFCYQTGAINVIERLAQEKWWQEGGR